MHGERFEDMPAISGTSDQVVDKVRQASLRLMMALSECYVRAVEAERRYVASGMSPYGRRTDYFPVCLLPPGWGSA